MTDEQPAMTAPSRRSLLRTAGLSAAMLPLAGFGLGVAAQTPPFQGAPKKITLAWMPTAMCMIAIPVAKAKGFFVKHNLDVDYVNWAGSTDLLLQALSTGKADVGMGMALRWLKPLEGGFDVKLTAGLHGGCMKVLAGPGKGLAHVTDLKGKKIGVGDLAGVDKNFFSIVLSKHNIDPNSDVEWRQFPPDMLGLAWHKGEIDAISTSDPLAFLLKKQYGLIEVANNLENGYENLSCCVLGIRGSLIREEPATAAAITAAFVEAAQWASENRLESAQIYTEYAPKQVAGDLAVMLEAVTSDHHPHGPEFQKEIASYVEDLKTVGVFRPSFNSARFAERIYANVLG